MKQRSALTQRILSLLSILGLAIAFTATLPFVAVAQQAVTANQEAEDEALDEEGLPPLPESPIEKAEREENVIYLSLTEVTKMALQNNLDIALEDTNEETSRLSLVSAEASYDPSLSGRFSLQSSRRANTYSYEESAADFITSKTYNWSANFSQPVKTGGTFSASYSTRRTSSDSSGANFNPDYSTQGSIEFTQPLLKNFTIDQNRGNIKIRKLDMETSDIDFKQTVTSRISQINQAYWDLVSAIRDYEIQRNSVRLAQISLRDNRKRVEVGTLAPIEITRSRFEVANREQMLTSREEQILQRMNNLRQQISSDRNDEIWFKSIIPTDSPEFQEYRIDEETAIETAMRNSPDLQKNTIDLQKADINLDMNRNNKKWGLDLTASFNNSGQAGTWTQDPSDPFYRPPPEDQVGGFGTAFKNMFTSGLYGWSLQFSVQVPLRNRSAESQYATQLIQKKRTIINRKKLEQQIVVQIRNAYQTLQTSRQQVETAKLRKELAQEQLEGEVKRFDAGLTENYRVLEEQESLATAENNELTQLINYKKAIINLQELMLTLLEESDFEISRSASDHIPDLY